MVAEKILGCLFGDDPVCPLHERDEYRGTAELCSPVIQVGFRYPTGTGTGSSGKNGDALGYDLVEGFIQGRPAYGLDGIGGDFAHEVGRLTQEEDLDVVTRVGQGESVVKGKRGPGWIVGSPRGLHHDLQALFGLGLGRGSQGGCRPSEKWQCR